MGMASSQARLLSLTARQHDVELRAQYLQAQKLRLANDSDNVYNNYLSALSATKIQTRVCDIYNGDSFQDATLAILENALVPTYSGTVAQTPLFLQDVATGKLYITPEIKAHFGLTEGDSYDGTLEEFLIENGVTKSEKVGEIQIPDGFSNSTELASFTPAVANTLTEYSMTLKNKGVENGTATAINYSSFVKEVTQVSEAPTGWTGISSLAELKSMGTTGQYILLNDITIPASENWTGISNFAGTFDGNGHTITITGSQGLFKNTKNTAEIKNVGIIADINGSNDVGGIVGSNTGKIDNCWVSGTINAGAHVGAICGTQDGANAKINDCSANINITANGYCIGGLSGHNSGEITNSRVSGEITNTYTGSDKNWVGGICGHNNGTTKIENCNVQVKINGSSGGGSIIGEQGSGSLTIDNVTFTKDLNPTLDVTNSGDFGTTVKFKEAIAVPSIHSGAMDNSVDPPAPAKDFKGDFYDNILLALVKSKKGDFAKYETMTDAERESIQSKITNYIQEIYDTDTTGLTDEEIINKYHHNVDYASLTTEEIAEMVSAQAIEQACLLRIANLNSIICQYIDGSSPNTTFINSLSEDVSNESFEKTNSTVYLSQYTIDKYEATVMTDKGQEPISETNGTVYYLSKETTKQNLLVAAKYADIDCTESQIDSFLLNYDFSKEEDLVMTQKINSIIQKYTSGKTTDRLNFNDLMNNYVLTNTKYEESIPLKNSIDRYNFVKDSKTPSSVTYSYKQVTKYRTEDVMDYPWSSAEVQKLMQEYYLKQIGFIVIGDETSETGLDKSNSWITNMINSGRAQFYKIEDIKTGKGEGTSLASEVSLQEIANTEYLKQAETEYEASMRKINRKESKVDNELSQLEAERTAIKTEQEDLKTVIKNNVDLTFKLFS